MTVPAMAEETTLLLEFVVNGRLTGMIGEFTSVEGALSATATELAELGLKVPEKLARSGKPIPRFSDSEITLFCVGLTGAYFATFSANLVRWRQRLRKAVDNI